MSIFGDLPRRRGTQATRAAVQRRRRSPVSQRFHEQCAESRRSAVGPIGHLRPKDPAAHTRTGREATEIAGPAIGFGRAAIAFRRTAIGMGYEATESGGAATPIGRPAIRIAARVSRLRRGGNRFARRAIAIPPRVSRLRRRENQFARHPIAIAPRIRRLGRRENQFARHPIAIARAGPSVAAR